MFASRAVGRMSALFLFFIFYANSIAYSNAQPTMAPTASTNAKLSVAPTASVSSLSSVAPTASTSAKASVAPTAPTGPQTYTVTQVNDTKKNFVCTVAVVAATNAH